MMHRLAAAGLLLLGLGSGLVAGEVEPGSNRLTPAVRAVQRTRSAVVNIHSKKIARGDASYAGSAGPANHMNGMGTGVIIDSRGYIVTNFHVVEDVRELRCTLVDGTVYPAEIFARDPQTDLALLRIRASTDLPTMPLGTSEDLMLSESVIAIGNAFGYEHTTTMGIISELHRDVRLSAEQSYRNLIQTDAAINPGNSGGPLINLDGEMIGLNVAIRAGAQNIGFAIPVDDVKTVLAKLLSIRTIRSTWHGMDLSTASLRDRQRGRVVVRRVESGSPAEAAGIQSGDRIVSVGQLPLTAAFDMERALLDRRPGDKADVVVVRRTADSSRELTLAMTLGSAPTRSNDADAVVWRRLGIKLAESPENSDALKRNPQLQLNGGLMIVEVARNSPAEQASLKAGDMFVGLEDRETLKLDHVNYMLRQPSANAAASMKFLIVRSGKLHWGMINVLADE